MSIRSIQRRAPLSSQVRQTRNALAVDIRHQSANTLNRVVAHAIDLALASKHAHWNVRGPNFMAYHTLFDRVFAELLVEIDRLGERTAALSGVAYGTVQAVASASQLEPYPVSPMSAAEHVEALSVRLGQLGLEIRHAATACAQGDDTVSVDVLTQAGTAVDTLLWLVESHGADDA